MEIKYYIVNDGESIEVNYTEYDEWTGLKYYKSGFVTEYSDGTIIDSSKLLLGLRFQAYIGF